MTKIIEKIIEPSRIEIGSIFKLKIKVNDEYRNKRSFITENYLELITENGDILRTEWGE